MNLLKLFCKCLNVLTINFVIFTTPVLPIHIFIKPCLKFQLIALTCRPLQINYSINFPTLLTSRLMMPRRANAAYFKKLCFRVLFD